MHQTVLKTIVSTENELTDFNEKGLDHWVTLFIYITCNLFSWSQIVNHFFSQFIPISQSQLQLQYFFFNRGCNEKRSQPLIKYFISKVILIVTFIYK